MANYLRVMLLVGLAGLTVAACSSSGSPAAKAAATTSATTAPPASTAPTPTTLSISQAGAEFLTDVAPATTALTTMVSAASALGNDPSASQTAAVAAPVITALGTLQTQLTAIDWPPVAKTDADTLITDVAVFKGDLETTSSQNAFSAASWESQTTSDVDKVGAADGILRHDLGLPAAAG
jgi:hypothetical protein